MIGRNRQPCDGDIQKHYYTCQLTYNRCVWCGHIEGSDDNENLLDREEYGKI